MLLKDIFRIFAENSGIMKRSLTTLLILCCATVLMAQDFPTFTPTVTFTDKAGTTSDPLRAGADTTMAAPATAFFEVQAENTMGYIVYYAWTLQTPSTTIKYGNDVKELEYQLLESGVYNMSLEVIYERDGMQYHWPEGEENTFLITILPSILKFPNAFSPNGDGVNDVFRAIQNGDDKPTSLLSFEATIFNRWGQKLYSWTDPEDGWDGTSGGKKVKDGVYFLRCKAKGADGREYNIKQAVNVLTGYTLPEE